MVSPFNNPTNDNGHNQQQKLLVYRLIAPVALIVLIGSTYFDFKQGVRLALFDYYFRIIFSVAYLILSILLWVKKDWLSAYEKIFYITIFFGYTAFHYAGMNALSNNSITPLHISGVFWIPILFFISYMVFNSTWALRINLVFEFILVVPTVIYVVNNGDSPYVSTLWNMEIARFAFILSLAAIIRTLSFYKKGSEKASAFEAAARLDHLTQINNRRSIDAYIRYLIDQREINSVPFSLILLDLDHFKLLNDTYGHLAGDKVLIGLSDLLKTAIRGNDQLGRWGGEEFILIMPETLLNNAAQIAERLRKMVAESNCKGYEITASFGVAEWRIGDTPESVVNRADRALYQAKEAGRNRVEISR